MHTHSLTLTHTHRHYQPATHTGSELISMLTHARQQFCYAYVLLALSASRRSGLAGKKCLPLLHTLMKLMFPSRTEQGIDRATERVSEEEKEHLISRAPALEPPIPVPCALDTHDFCLLEILIRLNYCIWPCPVCPSS